ncbi:MAG: response regulator [Acidobacteriota bacterium]|nr:response regulator [Acidobacteriota bacterium]
MNKLVLIVDDSTEIANSLALAIGRLDHVQTCIAAHPKSALRLFDAPTFQLAALITDFNLPSVDGLRLIGEIRRRSAKPALPAILITAQENIQELDGDTLSRPNFVFQKPFSVAEVCRVLKFLLE